MLGTIMKRIENKADNIILICLYIKSIQCPYLEYWVHFWSPPALKKDILELGKVQRRVTKMIKDME